MVNSLLPDRGFTAIPGVRSTRLGRAVDSGWSCVRRALAVRTSENGHPQGFPLVCNDKSCASERRASLLAIPSAAKTRGVNHSQRKVTTFRGVADRLWQDAEDLIGFDGFRGEKEGRKLAYVVNISYLCIALRQTKRYATKRHECLRKRKPCLC